jgi:hypothetical protein
MLGDLQYDLVLLDSNAKGKDAQQYEEGNFPNTLSHRHHYFFPGKR